VALKTVENKVAGASRQTLAMPSGWQGDSKNPAYAPAAVD
jgi:hypothetical protein